MSTTPTISVLLPCYNSAATLRESIGSLLAQTFSDFEVLILDDGSTDGPVPQSDDPRIELIRSDKNLGLGRQLNIGLERCRGEFVARLDADDLALPERFQKQLDCLRSSPEIGICGSQAQLFDAAGDREIWNYPTQPDLCHATLFLRSSFLHPGVMMRRSVIEEHQLRYDETLRVAQDYELWCRMLKHTSGTNLDECLTRYRISDSQLTSAHSDVKDRETQLIRATMLDELGVGGLDVYNQLLAPEWEESTTFFTKIADWLNAVFDANQGCRVFPPEAFAMMLAELFFQRCQCATRRGFDGLSTFRRLKFADHYRARRIALMRLRMKSVLKPSLAS